MIQDLQPSKHTPGVLSAQIDGVDGAVVVSVAQMGALVQIAFACGNFRGAVQFTRAAARGIAAALLAAADSLPSP